MSQSHTVSLTIPAKPDYVVLARLALSAVCRLAPLAADEVADLKLAITEAATWIMGGERRQVAREAEEADTLTFAYELDDSTMVLEISGRERPTVSAEERELSLAIMRATVDEHSEEAGRVRLAKRLDSSRE